MSRAVTCLTLGNFVLRDSIITLENFMASDSIIILGNFMVCFLTSKTWSCFSHEYFGVIPRVPHAHYDKVKVKITC